MANLENRRKIFRSTPVLVVASVLIFGVPLEVASEGPFSWIDVIIFGLPLGLLNIWFLKRQMQRAGRAAGISNIDQQWTLADSIRTGRLPKDPKLIKALPSFLEERTKELKKSRKQVTPLLLVFATLSLLLAIGGAGVMVLFAVLFPLFAMLNYKVTKRMDKKINVLREKLS